MSNDSINFARGLIKGRIAEVIFEQMMRGEDKYIVIPIGYEYTTPMLTQYRGHAEIEQIIDNIADAPDFALISKEQTPEGKVRIYLVEVKYRSSLNINDIKKHAEELRKRWEHPWLFVATPGGFYCGHCKDILSEGNINPLSENWVVCDNQSQYLELLKEFEK